MTAPVLPPAASTDDPMPASASSDVQQLLGALQRGETTDDDSGEVLFRHVYAELRALAKQHRRRWRGNPTLNTTALVHEAYLKLVGSNGDYTSRAHFLAVASKAMRHVLINYAERQGAQKRGGDQANLLLDEALLVPAHRTDELLALNEALQRLEVIDARAAQVVECRFFGGLDAEETAATLGLSRRTVTRDWGAARAWLYAELRHDTASPGPTVLDTPL